MKMPYISILVLVFCIWWLSWTKTSKAQTQDINATIRLSVCGDGVAEFPEECDGRDLNSQTCRELDFGHGRLSCDIACELDTSACTAPSATPTPSPIPTTSPSPTPTTASGDNNSGEEQQNKNQEKTQENNFENNNENAFNQSYPNNSGNRNNLINLLKPGRMYQLPEQITHFDPDNSGSIEAEELHLSLKLWVDSWRKNPNINSSDNKCDLNNDGRCDLVDFSVLLYFVNR